MAQTISDEPTLRVPASLRVVGCTGVALGLATVGGSALVYARGREFSPFTTYLSDIGNTPGWPQVVFNSGILVSAPVRYVLLVLLVAQLVHRGASVTFRQVALALGVLVVASTIGMAAILFSLQLTAHKVSALVYFFGVVVLQSLIAVQERRCGLPRLLPASTVAVVVINLVFATLLSLVGKVEAITRSTPVIWEWLAFVCHRALQNRPRVGTSKPARARRGFHTRFLKGGRWIPADFPPRSAGGIAPSIRAGGRATGSDFRA